MFISRHHWLSDIETPAKILSGRIHNLIFKTTKTYATFIWQHFISLFTHLYKGWILCIYWHWPESGSSIIYVIDQTKHTLKTTCVRELVPLTLWYIVAINIFSCSFISAFKFLAFDWCNFLYHCNLNLTLF